jgi:LysM repeat protein
MKTPKFLSKLSAVLTPRPKKKLQATARAARHTMDDYDDVEEPTTKLSSAFIVVLILHVVAVGGIYAFNSIKASRRDREAISKPAEVLAPVASKNAPSADKAASQEKAPAAPAAANALAANRKVEPANPAVAPVLPAAANAATTANTAKPPAVRRHQVKPGENLTKIAIAYQTTAAEIMAANQLKEGAVLRQGQSLVIPSGKTAANGADAPKTAANTATPANTATTPKADVPATRTTPGTYTVKKGDTMTSIAKSHGLSLEELTKANKNTDPKKLQLGQVLKLPRKG